MRLIRKNKPQRQGKPKGNYQQKITTLIEHGVITSSPGDLLSLNVQHDDWCAALAQTGDCNCNPDIYLNGERVA